MSFRIALVFYALLMPAIAYAQGKGTPPPKKTPEDIAKEKVESWKAAAPTLVRGPAEVKLRDQGTFKVPEGIIFVPNPAAIRIMLSLGNGVSPDFQGLAVSNKPDDQWMTVVSFRKQGYVADGDAKEWNADELLQSLKDGTEAANKDRIAEGFNPLEITGWIQPPAYDAETHRLVWSVAAKSSNSANSSVN